MPIVNINPAPDSLSVIDADEAPLTHKKVPLLAGGVKSFVLIKFFEDVRIVGKFENLSRNNRTALAEYCARILSQVVESSVYSSAAYPTQTAHDRRYFGRSPLGQQRSIRKKVAFHASPGFLNLKQEFTQIFKSFTLIADVIHYSPVSF